MKKILFVALAITMTGVVGCGPSKAELEEKARQDSIRVADSLRAEAEAKAQAEQEEKKKAEADSIARDKEIADFITDMYNNRKYEEETWLRKHCTKKMLAKLRADYDYDGEGLACWDFRSGEQDSLNETYKITEIKPLGNNWYLYNFFDMGFKGSHQVLVTQENGEWMIDGLK